jgi:hypothetical protein
MKQFLFIVLFMINPALFKTYSHGQSLKVTNVHHRIMEEKIEIFYDLPSNHDTLSIQVVFLKKSDPEFRYHPKYISGKLGIGIYSGKNNKITWNYKKEPANILTGNGFYFKIKASKVIPKKNSAEIPLPDSIGKK